MTVFTQALNIRGARKNDNDSLEIIWEDSDFGFMELIKIRGMWIPRFLVFSERVTMETAEIIKETLFKTSAKFWRLDRESTISNGTITWDFIGSVEDFIPGVFDWAGKVYDVAKEEDSDDDDDEY